MDKMYVIKYHDLFLSANLAREYSSRIDNAIKYAHPENARQRIEQDKLNGDHRIVQINLIEQEMK